ncbi:MAG: hypothetical protein KAU90_08455 [Sulfurovaceae bacterium]|nr:hypothetical protein [Sulfurovaceae bacterium]
MIFIITDKEDKHANTVISKLPSMSYFRFNLDIDSLKKTYITYQNNEWRLSQNGMSITSYEIDVIYPRTTFVKVSLEDSNIEKTDFKIWKGEWDQLLLGIYFTLRDKKWFIPLKDAYRAENKYLQYFIAKGVGFNLPKFLVSNNKTDLLHFSSEYKDVVIKFMNQEIYKDNKGKIKGIFVNKINQDTLLDFNEDSENPIVLQNYIEKKYEVRYIVVGNKHFVCKIESQKSEITKVDWRRYDIPNTPHYPIEAPEYIQNKVNKFMKNLNLTYGALDFIVTNDNQWYFLEINPMGQFLWIEDLTELQISEEIANWLKQNLK